MLKIALVVVDLQEDFLPPHGTLAISEGRSVIPDITDLLNIDKYPWLAIIVTQDWHPQDHCLFASQHGVQPYTELDFTHPLGEKNCHTGEVKKHKQFVWPDHCVQGTTGASVESLFFKKFEALKGDVVTSVVKKGYLQDREYYLCFSDCWKLHKTEMEHLLVANDITDVVFVGLAYDFCVLNSALDCLDCGFNTFVIKNCCKSVYPDKIAETEQQYRNGGVHIVESVDGLLKHYQ